MEGCDYWRLNVGFGCSWETSPPDKCKNLQCFPHEWELFVFLMLVMNAISGKSYGCERPLFSIGHLLQAPATQREPLTQMDVKNVQL